MIEESLLLDISKRNAVYHKNEGILLRRDNWMRFAIGHIVLLQGIQSRVSHKN